MRTALATLLLCAFSLSLYAASPNGPLPNDEKNDKSADAATFNEWTAAAPLLFVSSNTQPLVGMFDVSDVNNIMMSTFPSAANDADGIYYHRTNDVLFQLNRTDNVINSYTDVCVTPTLSSQSTSGVRNGREISVIGNKLVAAQDANDANGNQNKLVVYNIFPSTNVSFSRAFVVDINLWGIHADVNTLYAVVDNSNRIAVFHDFFNQPSGSLSPSMTVEIEGLVRTHGITYDADMDMMLLTDIGDAGSATDGALVMISNWKSASADGMVSMNEQARVEGPDSELGNPVDVAMDKERNRIYVAERANGGGKILGFEMPLSTGTIMPVYSQLFAGASAINFSGVNDMPDACELDVDGGMVSLTGGGTETTIIIDGEADMLSFESTSNPTLSGAEFTYVVTDADGMILGIPPGNMVDFDPAGVGACLVYGLSYTGELRIEMGDDLLSDDPLSDECFELSSNFITVNRVAEDMSPAGQFFVSSNTQALIGVYDVSDDAMITSGTIPSVAADADGIYYDRTNDVLYQLNRTDNVINAYSNVSTSPTLTATSTSDFTNGREIAVVGNRLVVAQDGSDANGDQNRLIVYTISPTAITFEKAFDVDINLWGIHGETSVLFAIVDNSDQVAVFNDFFNQTGTSLTPDMIVSVESMIRTHGITYDAAMDMMLLTDVGEASSATDGALVAISDWTAAAADGMISMDEQERVMGGASQLGNPVDIALDKERMRVYVAERASEGGKVLAYRLPFATGGIAPVYSELFAGASAVFFSDADDMPDECTLVVDGGMVSLTGGDTQTNIVIDGNPDMLSFESTSNPTLSGAEFTYIVTDADGMILGIPPGNMVDFDPAGVGACLVYGLSYTGDLQIEMGDDLFSGDALSDGCFELSGNMITVNRVADMVPAGQFFVSSNTQPVIGVYDVLDDATIIPGTIPSVAGDADGIYYDRTNDVIYQLNRTDNVINAYSDVSTSPTLTATSTSDFTNGREIAVVGNRLVVAQDGSDANGNQNRLVVYMISPTAITFEKAFDVDINLWGIHGETSVLFAIVDNSDQLAVFNDFFNQTGTSLTPDMIVSVESMVRTHGITYDAAMDLMLLTDVGEAASATDGALVAIPSWTAAAADGMISMDEQGRVKGGASQLGNPVDIALDKERRRIFVAERASGGGKVLVFKLPILTGGIAPVFSQSFPGASAVFFSDGDDMPDACALEVDGGTVSLEDGAAKRWIVIDGNADMLSFASVSNPTLPGASFTYVVTDADGMILGIPPGNMVDFDPAGPGACLVYGLSYTGTLQIEMGDDLFSGDMLSDGCFELSSNKITINRVEEQDAFGQVYFSSNTQPAIGMFNILEDNSPVFDTFDGVAADADGIYYDAENDVLYQLNRTDNVINLYGDVSTSPMLIATSTSDFSNGREIAVSGDKLVVAQDASDANGQQNRLVVYTITSSTITFEMAYDVDINLWGIHATEEDLIAIVDNSDQVAVFEDFFTLPAVTMLTPDVTVTVENMVRTHGITYDAAGDMLLLTDVGDAASATDGALVMIKNWAMASADGMISMSEQARVSGGASQLGNPVDIAMDKENLRMYVAERANGGGKILVFRLPILTGGIAPIYSQPFPGASAVHFSEAVMMSGIVGTETEAENLLEANLALEGNTQIGIDVKANLSITNVYPVPAIDQLNVRLHSHVEQEVTIGIFNATGTLLTQQRMDLQVGENQALVDVSSWPSGMYFIRIPGLDTTTRFVKAGK